MSRGRTWISLLAAFTLLASAELRAMSCVIASAPQFSFGAYDPMSPLALDLQTTLVVQCTPAFPGETLRMQISILGMSAPLQMLNPQYGDAMRFGIYTDPARSVPIDPHQPINISTSLGTTTTLEIPLYGRVPAGQPVSVGSYQMNMALIVDY